MICSCQAAHGMQSLSCMHAAGLKVHTHGMAGIVYVHIDAKAPAVTSDNTELNNDRGITVAYPGLHGLQSVVVGCPDKACIRVEVSRALLANQR